MLCFINEGPIILGAAEGQGNAKYLGQKSPGLTPELFAPDIIQTEHREAEAAFTPDLKEFYPPSPSYPTRVNESSDCIAIIGMSNENY